MNLFKKMFGKKEKEKFDMQPIVELMDKAINDLNKLSTNNETNVRKSQEKRVLAYLKDGYTITQLEALQMFGCMRLSDRIFTLRNKGYNIKTKMVVTNTGKKVGQYKLLK